MKYRNFVAAIYCTVHDIAAMSGNTDLEKEFAFLEKHVRIGKVYLETFRGGQRIDPARLRQVTDFFTAKGIAVAGGIAPVAAGSSDFHSLCYTRSEHRELLAEVVRFTAGCFAEIILDDFFFTNCRCESCIQAKGELGWSEFRNRLLREVTEEIVVRAAKQTNPAVKVIIKYPNWYDDYQATGYNLAEEPELCDGIYTGTETRDPRYTQQTLQRYQSYFLMRYLENVKPAHNGGGWFDGYDCRYNLGAYAEQCYLTLFAKAKEVTQYCWGSLTGRDDIFIPIAGYAFEKADAVLAQLGNPTGIACYKPYHSDGENYLHGYLGMLGLPLEPAPQFPQAAPLIILTESAATDPQIIPRIRQHLRAGNKVMITSGFLKAAAKADTVAGFEDLAGIRCSDRKVTVDKFAYPMHQCSFGNYYDAARPISIPQIDCSVNDCTPLIVAFAAHKNYPVLLQTRYGAGILYVLTVPDHYGDLYCFPAAVLDEIRRVALQDARVRLEGPAQIGLFTYDNDTFIIESFLPYFTDVKVCVSQEACELVDLVTGVVVTGLTQPGLTEFQLKVTPTAYRVFRIQNIN